MNEQAKRARPSHSAAAVDELSKRLDAMAAAKAVARELRYKQKAEHHSSYARERASEREERRQQDAQKQRIAEDLLMTIQAAFGVHPRAPPQLAIMQPQPVFGACRRPERECGQSRNAQAS